MKISPQGLDTAISVDTSRASVASAALEAGAEIINDISGLRFDSEIGAVAKKADCGIILMHSRGTFETMHKIEPVEDIVADVTSTFRKSLDNAGQLGIGQ